MFVKEDAKETDMNTYVLKKEKEKLREKLNPKKNKKKQKTRS